MSDDEADYSNDDDVSDEDWSEESYSYARGRGGGSDEIADVMYVDHDYCLNCCPLACTTFTGSDGSQSGRACQICLYKGRDQVLKDVVVCKAHKVLVCANISLHKGDLVDWLKNKKRPVSQESFGW